MADVWLPVRPGTDAALALAMLHVVILEDLVDHDFVEQWCYGFDKLREHVRQYPPEWAETITGVPAEQIREVAREYATTPRAAIDVGNGVEHAPAACDAIRGIAMLMAVTGHVDRPGTNLLRRPPKNATKNITLRQRYTQEFVNKLVAPEFPVEFQPFMEGTSSAYYRIFESVLTEKPYAVRAIIAPGTQPLASTRGTRNVLAALQKLDFFVIADVARTPEMPWADIVLPVATGYECDYPFQNGPNWLMATNQVIEPLGPYKSMIEFFLDLGKAMGYGADFWQADVKACMDDQLDPLGLDMAALRNMPTGLVSPPEPPEYEKYAKIFKRPSFRLDKSPFSAPGQGGALQHHLRTGRIRAHARMARAARRPDRHAGTLRGLSADSFRLPYVQELQRAPWQRNVPLLRENPARSPAAHPSGHGRGQEHCRRRLGAAEIPLRLAQGPGRALSGHPAGHGDAAARLVAGLQGAEHGGLSAHGRRGQRGTCSTAWIRTRSMIRWSRP